LHNNTDTKSQQGTPQTPSHTT